MSPQEDEFGRWGGALPLIWQLVAKCPGPRESQESSQHVTGNEAASSDIPQRHLHVNRGVTENVWMENTVETEAASQRELMILTVMISHLPLGRNRRNAPRYCSSVQKFNWFPSKIGVSHNPRLFWVHKYFLFLQRVTGWRNFCRLAG